MPVFPNILAHVAGLAGNRVAPAKTVDPVERLSQQLRNVLSPSAGTVPPAPDGVPVDVPDTVPTYNTWSDYLERMAQRLGDTVAPSPFPAPKLNQLDALQQALLQRAPMPDPMHKVPGVSATERPLAPPRRAGVPSDSPYGNVSDIGAAPRPTLNQRQQGDVEALLSRLRF